MLPYTKFHIRKINSLNEMVIISFPFLTKGGDKYGNGRVERCIKSGGSNLGGTQYKYVTEIQYIVLCHITKDITNSNTRGISVK